MNSINYYTNKLSEVVQSLNNFQRHTPPTYDIAVGIFRSYLVGSVCYWLFKINTNILSSELKGKGLEISILATIYRVALTSISLYKEMSSIFHYSNLNEISKNQSKKEVVLICGAKSDFVGEANRLSAETIKMIESLSQTHSIIFKKVGTIEDINTGIDEIYQQGRKIKLLWLRANGSSDSIKLGKERIVGKDSKSYISHIFSFFCKNNSVDKIHFEKLDPQCNILLSTSHAGDSSSTSNGLCIAEWFQFNAGPERKVFAPKTYSSDECVKIQSVKPDGTVICEFKNIFKTDITGDISYAKTMEKIEKQDSKS